MCTRFLNTEDNVRKFLGSFLMRLCFTEVEARLSRAPKKNLVRKRKTERKVRRKRRRLMLLRKKHQSRSHLLLPHPVNRQKKGN